MANVWDVPSAKIAEKLNFKAIGTCHRVIGKDGSMTGYGGGIERKKWLIKHELNHAKLRSA